MTLLFYLVLKQFSSGLIMLLSKKVLVFLRGSVPHRSLASPTHHLGMVRVEFRYCKLFCQVRCSHLKNVLNYLLQVTWSITVICQKACPHTFSVVKGLHCDI